MSRRDMTGLRYGNLTAVAPTDSRTPGSNNVIWTFACDCGRSCRLDGYAVRTGKRSSCQECGAERARLASVKHGKSDTREFSTWTDIQTRCDNPNSKHFADYGGRGIRVCARWRASFSDFLADMGPRPSSLHSIDRIDVNGHYEPNNCRWATAAEQAVNKRNTSFLTIDGVTKPLVEWADEAGINPTTLHQRARAGWTGRALLSRSRTGGFLEFQGVRDTYRGWSKRTGLHASTIAMRVSKYGWPIERALTEGASL